jgi:diguanylate cyclase
MAAMTVQGEHLAIARGADGSPGSADGAAAARALAGFDQIRRLVVDHRLVVDPESYELLWRYVRDEDHGLSLAVDTAIALGRFDGEAIARLRQEHGAGRASDVGPLVVAARTQAEGLTRRIEAGRSDLADYGRAIADGGARLESPLDAMALAGLLGDLGNATATMQAANARLESELAAAASEARTLAAQLGEAERAAVTDALTGVLNRRGTFAALADAQAAARAAGADLAVAMVDIDHFKRFNDRFGHPLGDEVLRFVASRLADCVAPLGGIVGRLGGEEFIALLPGHDAVGGAAIIDKVRAQLAGQILRNAADGSSMGRVSFSAGVAADRAEEDCDMLVARADRALYTAKRMGRDRVVPDRG